MMKTLQILLFLSLFIPVEAIAQPREIPGLKGAVRMPVEMTADGIATLALYEPDGTLVRILGQSLRLAKGKHIARWDGLDLWGQAVPAGTSLELRVITGPGVTAHWEFGLASPNPVPWPTRPFGEGDDMRTGGWMGDHGINSGVVNVGNRMFLSSTVAEHGHTLIMTNLDGEKMWGRRGYEGWKGPQKLSSDGRSVFGSVLDTRVYQTGVDTLETKQIADTAPHKIRAMSAHQGRLSLVLENADAVRPFLDTAVKEGQIQYKKSLPTPANRKAPRDQLNPRQQFATTLNGGGHPQTGIQPVGGDLAWIRIALTEPLPLGSLLVGQHPEWGPMEIYVQSSTGQEWVPAGQGTLRDPLNLITLSQTTPVTGIEFRFPDLQHVDPSDTLKMARILHKPVRALPAPAVQLPEGTESQAQGSGWSFRSQSAPTRSAPTPVLLTWPTPQPLDGLILLNLSNARMKVDAWTGDGTPDANAETGWSEIAAYTARSTPFQGSFSSSRHHHDARISFQNTVHSTALRLRMEKGLLGGRWGTPINQDDPKLFRVDAVLAVTSAIPRSETKEYVFTELDSASGEELLRFSFDQPDIRAMAHAPDGTLYGVGDGGLYRVSVQTGSLDAEILPDAGYRKPTCIGISPDGSRIAVGDSAADTVFVVDPSGLPLGKVGGIGPRKAGPWDPRTVDRPTAVAIDPTGDIWVAEGTYTPKRFTRYDAEGRFEAEWLGPPHYGGGGTISRELDTFWYQAVEYDVDFEAGTTRPAKLIDVQYDPVTPTLDKTSYSYNKVQRPVYLNGRRYLVGDAGNQFNHGGYIIVIHDPGQDRWKPAAVMGDAQNSVFLVREDKPWHTHWIGQDLKHKSFIWYDANGDGAYQIEEVDLFENRGAMKGARGRPFQHPYWGTVSADDLTFWGQFTRLAPRGFTDEGVPIFKKEDLQTYHYEKLVPKVYTENFTATSRAKPGFNRNLIVDRNGNATLEGQPYKISPEMSLVGGPVDATPAEKLPRIPGIILNNPLTFVGKAMTGSGIGEVAVVNGVNGQWFLWSLDHNVVLAEFFTGEKGRFGSVTHPERGMEMTGYAQDWETFFGYFLRAANGNYYTIAGRGHFGLFELRGIEEFRIRTYPIQVTEESAVLNVELREAQARSEQEAERWKPPQISLTPNPEGLRVDGDLREWREDRWHRIRGQHGLRFALGYDRKALTLAYQGTSPTVHAGEDWRYVFKNGFCLDVMLRTRQGSTSSDPAIGDIRLSIAPFQEEWTAVLYDYHADGEPGPHSVTYSSPVMSTKVDRVIQLPRKAVDIAFRAQEKGKPWTAEVRIPWQALGMSAPKPDTTLLMDVGVLVPDSGGLQVASRNYWSNPFTTHVADVAVEAEIEPKFWGKVRIKK